MNAGKRAGVSDDIAHFLTATTNAFSSTPYFRVERPCLYRAALFSYSKNAYYSKYIVVTKKEKENGRKICCISRGKISLALDYRGIDMPA
jgi:hypothetical protein